MKIQVTQEHINKGITGSACFCPIALAANAGEIGRKFGPVRVMPSSIMVDTELLELPAVAKLFIIDFDHGHPVEPFEFDLEI